VKIIRILILKIFLAHYYISVVQRSWSRAFVAATILIAAACSRPATRDLNDALRIEPLALGASEPSLAPQLTVTADRALVSWIETQGRTSLLKFAERTPAGWSEPRTAGSGDDWFTNWADVPSVFRLDTGTLVAQWLRTTDAANEAYDVRLAFSKDEGRTWSAPTSPHHDGTKTEHGFASLFPAPDGGFGIVWLDGRAMETDAKKGNDNMSVRAAEFDRDGKQLGETLVDERACDCCPTAVAMTAEGPIAAFRDRSPDEVRDISVARRVNGQWTRPTTVHGDGWQITACPVNGPAVSARGRRVAVAWMTAKDDQGRAFAAFSSDAGATFGAPIRLDDGGSLGRVGIALVDEESAVASWIEFTNQRAQLRVRRITASGARGRAQTVAGVGAERTSGYPRLARRGDELLLAWTETSDGRSKVRTAVAHW
jgi:hypothetical protein